MTSPGFDRDEFDRVMAETVANPIENPIIPRLSSNPYTAYKQVKAAEIRMPAEMRDQIRRSTENWLAGGDGMIDEWKD